MLRPAVFAATMIAAQFSVHAVMAQGTNADTVVATVNGQPITLGQMIVTRQSLNDPQFSSLPVEAQWDLLMDQLVGQTALAATGQEDAGFRAQLEVQRRNLLAANAISDIAEKEPTEEEISSAYKELFADGDSATEYSAAHILVKTEELARDLKKQIDEGADFGTLAEENSTGPSGPNKGDLGWFTADQMVPEFAAAVEALEPGKVSEPVKTDFGWHLIKLNDSRVKEAPDMEEIRPQLAQLVRRQRVEAEIERITADAEVEKTRGFDPALLDETELLEEH